MDDEERMEVVREVEQWFDTHSEGGISLYLQEHHRMKDGSIRLDMAFFDDTTFMIFCPSEYPNGKNVLFDIRTTNERLKKEWLQKVKDYATENRGRVKLPAILSKCVELRSERPSGKEASSISVPTRSPQDSDFEEEMPFGSTPSSSDDELTDLALGDDNFSTDWDVKMDMLKKRWKLREKLAAEEVAMDDVPDAPSSSSSVGTATAPKSADASVTGPVPKKTKFEDRTPMPKAGQQIFDHDSAAFQILSNEMIDLLKKAKRDKENKQPCEFTCDTVEDSLYRWRVKIGAFPRGHPLHDELSALKTKYGYDTIELQLDFIPEFPFYPPLLRLVRPRLKGSLVQSVANIDILKLTFWNPTKTVHDVLKQIKEILTRHAKLDVDNERNNSSKHPKGAYLPLEDYLIKLALATEVRPRANFDVISFENLEKAPQIRTRPVATKEKSVKASGGWKSGIGYGSGARTSGWNPEAYVIAQQEKDKQILGILKCIIEEIKSYAALVGKETDEVYAIVEGSCLVPFLEDVLSVESFIEISRHLEVYQLALEVIETLSEAKYLLPLLGNIPRQRFCITALLQNLRDLADITYMKEIGSGSDGGAGKSKQKKSKEKATSAEDKASGANKKMKEDQEMANAKKIVELFEKLAYRLSKAGVTYSTKEQTIGGAADGNVNTDQSPDQRYTSRLKSLQFSFVKFELSGPGAHKFAKNADDKLSSSETRAISKEWTSLKTSLPLDLKSSVFVRVDDSHINLLQALIVGREGTPYANGCFVFDICFPLTYPAKPPQVLLRTTGGGRVRFNPNLYNCGKVCLSLLGTWSGESGESWNAKTSTLLQVLVSIQSLILVDEPYFNEPGFEKSMDTEEGKQSSAKYNKDVRASCLRYAMLEQLQQPEPGFEDVVRLHYQIKKDTIVKQLDDWVELDSGNAALKLDVEKMKGLMNDLPPL